MKLTSLIVVGTVALLGLCGQAMSQNIPKVMFECDKISGQCKMLAETKGTTVNRLKDDKTNFEQRMSEVENIKSLSIAQVQAVHEIWGNYSKFIEANALTWEEAVNKTLAVWQARLDAIDAALSTLPAEPLP